MPLIPIVVEQDHRGERAYDIYSRLLRDRIVEVLKSLAPREREVIELRFGLKDGTPKTLDEVARLYGITRERIRQIEVRAFEKLQAKMRELAKSKGMAIPA